VEIAKKRIPDKHENDIYIIYTPEHEQETYIFRTANDRCPLQCNVSGLRENLTKSHNNE